MAAISQVVPNLLGGVSQQPDPLKLPGQVKEAENVLLDPTFGCRKRPPTQFVGELATNVPAGAKWFNIFRDQNERYVVAIYRTSGTTNIRVWEADTAVERTVTINSAAGAYLDASDVKNINPLTINDYTLLCNTEKLVTMSNSTVEEKPAEALVVVNQVAYNTTYVVDFLKDGQNLVQEKVYKARKLSISPGSFEDPTGSSCAAAGSQTFVQNGSGSQVGLGFTVTTNCSPTLVTTEEPGEPYPSNVSVDIPTPQIYFTSLHGSSDNYAPGSYLYSNVTVDNGNLTLRVEARVNKKLDPTKSGNRFDLSAVTIAQYQSKTPGWAVGDGGQHTSGGATATYTVTAISEAQPTPVYNYKSVYSSRVTLTNGGAGWRVGDSVSVTMNGQGYTITVEEEDFGYAYASEATASFTTPVNANSGTLSVGDIVSGLTSSISALSAYTATPVGNVIHITRSDTRDFNIQTRGGTVNQALYGIKGSVNDVSLLPNQCVADMILLVRNSMDSDADDYYVKFKPAAGDIPGQGSWEECAKPGIDTQLNPATMPHVLIRESNGDFTVRPLTSEFDESLYWAPREVGDENSNPEPSFVGQRIKDMFFYQNRLGFLSSESVIMSQPGDYFNFFVGSAIAVSDADPIDMAASSTKPASLKAALGTPKGLLLFAENSQFLLSTTDVAFGPATVSIKELAQYSYSSEIQPLETGVSILFSTEADTFTKVYEMAVDSVDNRPVVSENTRIVPEYIPPGLTIAASSPNNSLCIFGDGSRTLYTFKFFNTGNERSLAGWSKWIMPSPVEMVAYDHDTGYFVCHNGTSHVLLKMEMLDDPRTSPISAFGSRFAPRLDHSLLKTQTTVAASSVTGKSIVRFPAGAYVDEMQPTVILTENGDSTLYRSPEIESDSTGKFITIDTTIADQDFILGIDYTMKVVLPNFFVTQDKRADRKNIPMVENVYLDLYYSGRYTVDIDRKGYEVKTVDLDVTTADIYLANSAAIDEITSKQVPVYCRGDFAELTIKTPDPLPASITSYRWEGHYNNRGISILT
jgi:hypothetical protein|tara:strand:+ start:695 stop:3790 length:3096 start_codon:yes stop_codon:yes gene_type:complete